MTVRTMIGTPDPDDDGALEITTHGGEVVGSMSIGMGGAGVRPPDHLGAGGGAVVFHYDTSMATGGGAAGADRYQGAASGGAGGVGHNSGAFVMFADEPGPELTEWQRDVVELAYRTGDDERPAQRPHKRRRRPLVGATVRWGRCVAYGGVGGVLVGLIVGLR